MKFHDKISLLHVFNNSPNSQDEVQTCCNVPTSVNFGKVSSTFYSNLRVLICEFCGISWIYLNFRTPWWCEIPEALFTCTGNSDFLALEQLFILSISVHITPLQPFSAIPPCQLLWLINCMTWMILSLIFLVEDMTLIYHGQHFQGMCTNNNIIIIS